MLFKIIDSCLFCKKILRFWASNPQLLCASCGEGIPVFSNYFFLEDLKIHSLFVYNNISCSPILTLKYNHQPFIAQSMAFIMVKNIAVDFSQYDYLIPIPTTAKKLFYRGYNQASILAQYLSKYSGIPCCNILEKLDSSSQRNKNTQERRSSIKEKFNIKNHILNKIGKNKRAIIVDDVVTTGSTLLSSYYVLKPYFQELRAMTFVGSGAFLPKHYATELENPRNF